jgi:hypothetical protein
MSTRTMHRSNVATDSPSGSEPVVEPPTSFEHDGRRVRAIVVAGAACVAAAAALASGALLLSRETGHTASDNRLGAPSVASGAAVYQPTRDDYRSRYGLEAPPPSPLPPRVPALYGLEGPPRVPALYGLEEDASHSPSQ